ncbi:hypothetical protein T08_3484 [Trichinella sp. T8]|nr:hypothetical protein T08_3484 [Trichinella sp. T8]
MNRIKLKHASVPCFLFVDFDMASFSLHCAHCKQQTENFDHTSYMIHSYLSADIRYLDKIQFPLKLIFVCFVLAEMLPNLTVDKTEHAETTNKRSNENGVLHCYIIMSQLDFPTEE